MRSSCRCVTFVLLCVFSLMFSMPAMAQDDSFYTRPTTQAHQDPGFVSMAVDVAVVRPAMFAVTLGGAAVFVASLPFTLLSHSVHAAGEKLIKNPARSTFTRCLGCNH